MNEDPQSMPFGEYGTNISSILSCPLAEGDIGDAHPSPAALLRSARRVSEDVGSFVDYDMLVDSAPSTTLAVERR